MKLSLVVQNAGSASGQSIPITKVPFVVGRDPSCHLRPASALISKKHCALIVKGGQVIVQDFGSTNGTSVNDKPVTGEAILQKDDVLKIGPLTFRVVIEHTVLKTGTPTSPTPIKSSSATPAHGMPKLTASVLTPNAVPPKPVAKPVAAKPAAPRASDPDDAAAMLLSDGGDDDTASDIGGGGLKASDIPSGNTEILPALKSTEETTADNKPVPPAAKPEEKKKIVIGSAQDAAKAILDKLTRRK